MNSEVVNIELQQVFGSLKSRLYNIEDGHIKITTPNPYLHIDGIEDKVYHFPPNLALAQVDALVDKVQNLIDQFPAIFDKVASKNPDPPTSVFDELDGLDNPESPLLKLKADLLTELNEYKSLLQRISLRLDENILSYGADIDTNKLQFNLSVEQLCGLLRIFKEANIIDTGTTNRAIKDAIIHNLSAKHGGGNGPKQIENSLSPTPEILKFWEDKLHDLLKIATKLRRKKED